MNKLLKTLRWLFSIEENLAKEELIAKTEDPGPKLGSLFVSHRGYLEAMPESPAPLTHTDALRWICTIDIILGYGSEIWNPNGQ